MNQQVKNQDEIQGKSLTSLLSVLTNLAIERINSVQRENGMLQGLFLRSGLREAGPTYVDIETIRQIQVDKAIMQGSMSFSI